MGDEYKVLLVEDEINIATLFKYNLKKAGYICKWGENGREGFELAKSFKPDIIISDIMMPEVDGFEFRKMLVSDPLLKSIPFVFLTAKGEEDDILQGYDLDIEDYIIKTASPKVVLAKIKSLLNSKQKEREKAVDEVHKAAENLGAKVVPDEYLKINGFEVKHWHQTFENIPGGDFIDYVPLDENRGLIVLGDVMGKKWKAWYFAVAYAGYVRSSVRIALRSEKEISSSSILERVNESVYHDERISEVFVTLTILLLDNNKRTIQYAGAGDLPLLYKSKNEIKTIESNGLLLGFDANAKYNDINIEINSGDELFLFTDGIIESRDPDGEMYTKERIEDSIKEVLSDSETFNVIKEKFVAFTHEKFEDDISLIGIKIL